MRSRIRQIVPSLLSILPADPNASLAFTVAFITVISPRVVLGDKALNAALAVVCPVPPFAYGKVFHLL